MLFLSIILLYDLSDVQYYFLRNNFFYYSHNVYLKCIARIEKKKSCLFIFYDQGDPSLFVVVVSFSIVERKKGFYFILYNMYTLYNSRNFSLLPDKSLEINK